MPAAEGAFSPRQGVFGDGLKNIYEKYDFFEKTLDFFEKKCYNSKVLGYVPLAQLDRASDYGSEGREFESSRARLRPFGIDQMVFFLYNRSI